MMSLFQVEYVEFVPMRMTSLFQDAYDEFVPG